MNDRKDRVCPVEMAGSLDTKFRRILQNPGKILRPYIREGMTVLDFGCGPGFFTIEIAQMVGKTGRVFAVDLQDGMIQKLKEKIQGMEIEDRIILHKSETNKIGLTEEVDFALAFYVLHELTDKDLFFNELSSILRSKGQVLIVEPPFHVSKAAFSRTIKKAENSGFIPEKGPRLLLSKTVILNKI